MTSHFLENLLIFGRLLRRAGVQVQSERLAEIVEAVKHVDLRNRDDVYHTCRALLVHRHDQLALFDAAFAAFWREVHGASSETRTRPACSGEALLAGTDTPRGIAEHSDDARDDPSSAAEARLTTWSAVERLAAKELAAFTLDEIAVARAALSRLVWQPGRRRTRRWRPGRGSRIDLRRAAARSLRTGGDVVHLPRRRRIVRPRPLVMLCDISGSMEPYSRMLVYFAHAVTERHGRVETFLFSTRLTRVSRALRAGGAERAFAAVSAAVTDWSGGTRIGAVLKQFHQRWGRRLLNGGPVVLLISDGWDRGDPVQLRNEVARLQRSCHRLIWLSPLIGSAGYAPLTRGLQAALPFVDHFLPVRTLSNLAQLALHLNALD